MATSRFARLTVVGAIAAMALTGACSSDSSGGSNPKLGTLLKNSEGAPELKDSVFTCLDDYDDASDISSDGVELLKDSEADLTEMDAADLKIVAGAMDECVSAEDFAESIAADGSVPKEAMVCLIDKLGGVGEVFLESAKGAEEPSADFTAAMTECITAE